jgi:D-galactarolactone cycloisomerase
MADGNGAYTLPAAVRVGRELDRLGFDWFEEPLPQPHYAGYEALRRKLDIALAGGEVLDGRGAAQQLLLRETFDIIQPDVSLCGGIGECLFIAEMARLWGVQCHPHCYAGAVSVAATLHVLALLPDASWGHTPETPLLEFDVTENPYRDRLTTQPPQVERDGCMAVPTGPGLGIEVDEEALKQFECR